MGGKGKVIFVRKESHPVLYYLSNLAILRLFFIQEPLNFYKKSKAPQKS